MFVDFRQRLFESVGARMQDRLAAYWVMPTYWFARASSRVAITTVFFIFALLCCAPASAIDLSTMSPADIRALQQRLTDAICYSGPVDGVASAAVTAALKICPAMDPILSIETGMHIGSIWSVGVDRDCKLLATGSEDKAIRLWSLPDGHLLRTLRVPIGPGNGGKVWAVAMAPDGRLIAAAGWDAHSDIDKSHGIYLFDAATGSLRARVGSFDNVVDDLAFSADGHYLAVALAGKRGLRVIDVARASEIAADRDYGDSINGVAFAVDGRLFTTSYDGNLRSYDSKFHLMKKVKNVGGNRPYGIAVDPSGQFLAVGDNQVKAVDIYRSSDLEHEYAANTSNLTGSGTLNAVAWSHDGSRLAAVGHFGVHGNDIVIWDRPGPERVPTQNRVADNTIMTNLPCGGGFVVGSAEPSFSLLDSSGRRTLNKPSVAPDLRSMSGGFRISADGQLVRFDLESGKHPIQFDVSRAALDEAGDQLGLAPPNTTGINVTDWTDSPSVKLNGKPLPLEQQEIARSLAIARDGKRFALGTSYALSVYNVEGTPLWSKQVPGEAWSINLTSDGRLVVAAYADGTIRWHRLSDGQELLALFVNKNDLRWVAWTPSGYYMSSPGGEDMIGWHLNRGWEQAADFFPASRFRERFSRPDIVQQVLRTLDEGEAIEVANRAANIRPDVSSVSSRLPPIIKILSPSDGSSVRDGDITVEYEVRSPSGQPVDSIEIQIDGRPARGFRRVETKADGKTVEHERVSIPPRNVQLSLVARAGSMASEVSTVRLNWTGAASSTEDILKPKLYGLVVGVSNYHDASLNLHYPAKDARDFADALKAQQGGLYRDVELKVLTDADATSSEVKRALTWLEKSVTSRDVGIVYLAGHGVTDAKQRYYYLTYDSDPQSPEDAALEGVILTDRTRSIAGKVLVFLDTCHAGQAMASRDTTYINKVVEDLSSTDNGIVTYASSTGKQLSLEDDSWHNGAFTKALIEGLPGSGRKGQADVTHKGVISTAGLDLWLAERVKELTHGAQTPVMKRPDNIPDFPLFAAER
jgi:WD40 repeat protein